MSEEMEIEAAQKVIRILVNNKIIPPESGEELYLKVWDAALEIVKQFE